MHSSRVSPVLRSTSLLCGLTTLAACAVGPDFKRPVSPPNAGYMPQTLPGAGTGPYTESLQLGQDISADWWTVFKSPALNDLVKRAFAHNPTIEAAQETLRGSKFDVYAQLGYFAPTVSAGYSFERQQLAGNEGGNAPGVQGNGTVISTAQTPGQPPYNQPVTYNLHTAQVSVGYTPDVFGSNLRSVEALRATSRYQRFELEAAYITLASNVVAAALQEALLRAEIAAETSVIAENTEGLTILRHQSDVGYAMGIDVAAEEAALAQAQQTLPPLEKQLAQTRDLIRELAGNLPNQDVPDNFTLESLNLPQALPVSLPSKLIEQRPDIRAAEEQWHQASAQVGVAVAARLPVFNITAADGGVASVFDRMFSHGGPFWNVSLAATQPIFDGFTLYNKERSARAALRVAAAQYRGTVLTAFQNVADTLHAVAADAHAMQAAAAAEKAAKVTLDITGEQARTGFVNYLTLLSAQQAYQQALLTRVQAQAMQLGDAASLYQALGGGWWNRAGPVLAGAN
jgi:NodT family efflux transporter outer membrane factor (OMF) lipoprotein